MKNWMFSLLYLCALGCGDVSPAQSSMTVASSAGSEEPSVICPNRTRSEDLEALTFEMALFDDIARSLEQGDPEDAENNALLVNSMSRILRYREHDSACAIGRSVQALASNCRPRVRHCYHEQLPILAREAGTLCPEDSREAGTIAYMRACDLAD